MAQTIDWMYHRKNCTSCKKARGFLEQHSVGVKSDTDATKERRGMQEAVDLAKTVSIIHIAKGKGLVTIDMKKSPPDDEAIGKLLLGPSGNLRAPTIRKGKTLYVGFHEQAYLELVK